MNYLYNLHNILNTKSENNNIQKIINPKKITHTKFIFKEKYKDDDNFRTQQKGKNFLNSLLVCDKLIKMISGKAKMMANQ